MDTVDLIIKLSTEFYNDLKTDENGRYRSWEHCYSHFIKARGNPNADYDYLSLQLAFYLASWGMYRGSSFLLQKDYRIHIPVVKEMIKRKPYPAPIVKLNPEVKDFYQFTTDDLIVENYETWPQIKNIPIAV